MGGVGLSGDEAPEGPGSGFGPGSARPWGDFHARSRIYWSLAMGLALGQTCRVLNLAAGRDRILPFEKWQCRPIGPDTCDLGKGGAMGCGGISQLCPDKPENGLAWGAGMATPLGSG